MTVSLPLTIAVALCKADLSGHQRRALDYVIIRTFGDSRPTASITLEDAAQEIDLSTVETQRMLKTLVDRRILKAAIPPRGTRRGIYRVNPNVGTWLAKEEDVVEMVPVPRGRRTPTKTLAQTILDQEKYSNDRATFIDNFHAGFFKYTSQLYPFSAKDMGLINTLLKRQRMPLEQLQRLLVRFFAMWEESEFMQKSGNLTVSFFASRIQNLIAAESVEELVKEEVDARLQQWATIRAEAKGRK